MTKLSIGNDQLSISNERLKIEKKIIKEEFIKSREKGLAVMAPVFTRVTILYQAIINSLRGIQHT